MGLPGSQKTPDFLIVVSVLAYIALGVTVLLGIAEVIGVDLGWYFFGTPMYLAFSAVIAVGFAAVSALGHLAKAGTIERRSLIIGIVPAAIILGFTVVDYLRWNHYKSKVYDVTGTNATGMELQERMRIVFDNGFEPVAGAFMPGQSGTHGMATARIPDWVVVSWSDSDGESHRQRVSVKKRACNEFVRAPEELQFELIESGTIRPRFFVADGEYSSREVCAAPVGTEDNQ